MYQQIVVGTDGSAGASVALEHAMELARLSGATLHVVSAHKVTTPYQLAAASEVGMAASAVGESNEAIHAQAQRICDHAVERAEELDVTAVAHCVPGDAADALLTVAKDTQCDLLVVGNRGMTGVRRFVLGSVPNKLSHNSPASLLIVDTSTARS
jgi:nucleotide-binding universal stress UspA family protein